jgi:hypothetical protein
MSFGTKNSEVSVAQIPPELAPPCRGPAALQQEKAAGSRQIGGGKRQFKVRNSQPLQPRVPENWVAVGFEASARNPSPGPLRLVKAPAAGHPLPKGEGGFPNPNAHQKWQPSRRGERQRRKHIR